MKIKGLRGNKVEVVLSGSKEHLLLYLYNNRDRALLAEFTRPIAYTFLYQLQSMMQDFINTDQKVNFEYYTSSEVTLYLSSLHVHKEALKENPFLKVKEATISLKCIPERGGYQRKESSHPIAVNLQGSAIQELHDAFESLTEIMEPKAKHFNGNMSKEETYAS